MGTVKKRTGNQLQPARKKVFREVAEIATYLKASKQKSGTMALFAGPSGSGKTKAVKTLAADTGLDVYRIDLAAVVNKYIGETEKKLARVLETATARTSFFFSMRPMSFSAGAPRSGAPMTAMRISTRATCCSELSSIRDW